MSKERPPHKLIDTALSAFRDGENGRIGRNMISTSETLLAPRHNMIIELQKILAGTTPHSWEVTTYQPSRESDNGPEQIRVQDFKKILYPHIGLSPDFFNDEGTLSLAKIEQATGEGDSFSVTFPEGFKEEDLQTHVGTVLRSAHPDGNVYSYEIVEADVAPNKFARYQFLSKSEYTLSEKALEKWKEGNAGSVFQVLDDHDQSPEELAHSIATQHLVEEEWSFPPIRTTHNRLTRVRNMEELRTGKASWPHLFGTEQYRYEVADLLAGGWASVEDLTEKDRKNMGLSAEAFVELKNDPEAFFASTQLFNQTSVVEKFDLTA